MCACECERASVSRRVPWGACACACTCVYWVGCGLVCVGLCVYPCVCVCVKWVCGICLESARFKVAMEEKGPSATRPLSVLSAEVVRKGVRW